MKKTFSILILCLFVMLSCEGPQGPPGVPGPSGGQVVAPAFEIALDFTPENNYEFVGPYGFTIFPSDVTLVYMLWETNNGQEIWRLLPQTVNFTEGTLTYNFDFTRTDVRFFLEGSVNPAILDSSWTRNQVFRVVVVPADNVGKIDYSNFEAVTAAYGITNFNVR
ncbi:hypothetical protein ACFSQP_02865 [Bizionia sediminis]|uniref:Collagen-like protein n=1 Tax=Bizionia sediminis TaxID=1737064 RepID=A0ABW5KQX6_9FLAO